MGNDDDPSSSVYRYLLTTAPPGPTTSHPSCDHPSLMAKRSNSLHISVPIGAPSPKFQRAGERTEPRRASPVSRRQRGERLAVYEDQLEVLPA
jgi:hypothetical protein